MSDRVGDRLLIGVLVLIACFAVFVTVSGQSSPTPKHGHCNPFDPDCDPDATFTSTATATHTPNAAATRLAVVLTAAAKLTSTAVAEKTAAAKLTATSVAKTATAAATQTAAAKTATAAATQTAAAKTATAAATQTAAAKTATAAATQTAAAKTATAAATQTAAAKTATRIAANKTATAIAAKTATAIAGIHTATPTPTPTPTPAPVALDKPAFTGYTHKAYRWIRVHWTSVPSLVDFTLEWRDDHMREWTELEGGSSGARVTINGPARYADVRGIEHRTGDIWFRVTGQTEDGRTATSEARTAPRTRKPAAIGHQHDHQVTYDLSQLAGTPGSDVGMAATDAAGKWHREAHVSTCTGSSCNDDVVRVLVESSSACIVTGITGKPERRIACVKGHFGDIEKHLGALTMGFAHPPTEDITRDGVTSPRYYQWTRIAALDRTQRPSLDPLLPPVEYRFIDPVALHEFSHAIGMLHYGDPHVGIANSTSKTITADDRARLDDIYESHGKDSGW